MTELTRKVRVALLGPHLGAVSGVSTHLRNLLYSDLQQNYELIHFRVGSEGPEQDDRAMPALIRVLVSPLILVWHCLMRDIQIVHINTSMETRSFWRDTLNLLLVKLIRRRVVYQIHGGELPDNFLQEGFFFRRLIKPILSLADVIVVLAEVELAAYESYLPHSKITLIPNAIDCVQRPKRRSARDVNEPLNLLYAGRLAVDKGIHCTLEAIVILRQRGLRVNLALVGSGPAYHEISDNIRVMGIIDQVQLLGPTFGESLSDLWNRADIFVFPTEHREGLPYALLEAMRAGAVPITTRKGGIPDVVKNNINGLLIEPGNAAQLADALEGLARDQQKLLDISSSAQDTIYEHYSSDLLVNRFRELYKNQKYCEGK